MHKKKEGQLKGILYFNEYISWEETIKLARKRIRFEERCDEKQINPNFFGIVTVGQIKV